MCSSDLHNQGGRLVDDLRKEMKDGEAREQREREVRLAGIRDASEIAGKDHAEDHEVESQHQEWVQDRPRHSEQASLVSRLEVALRELPEQLPPAAQQA